MLPMNTDLPTTSDALDASTIRTQNSRLILNRLWEAREISRAELARRTTLSRSTVSAIVSDLLSTGLIQEDRAGDSNGGRRPILLKFEDRSSFIVGVELGASHVSCVLTDLRCNVQASCSNPAPVRDAPKVALEKMSLGVRRRGSSWAAGSLARATCCSIACEERFVACRCRNRFVAPRSRPRR